MGETMKKWDNGTHEIGQLWKWTMNRSKNVSHQKKSNQGKLDMIG